MDAVIKHRRAPCDFEMAQKGRGCEHGAREKRLKKRENGEIDPRRWEGGGGGREGGRVAGGGVGWWWWGWGRALGSISA